MSDHGAEPLTNLDDLADVLTAMYYQRADFGLETPKFSDLTPLLDTYSCSEGTDDAAEDILLSMLDGIESIDSLTN